jgi:hypothetical protein
MRAAAVAARRGAGRGAAGPRPPARASFWPQALHSHARVLPARGRWGPLPPGLAVLLGWRGCVHRPAPGLRGPSGPQGSWAPGAAGPWATHGGGYAAPHAASPSSPIRLEPSSGEGGARRRGFPRRSPRPAASVGPAWGHQRGERGAGARRCAAVGRASGGPRRRCPVGGWGRGAASLTEARGLARAAGNYEPRARRAGQGVGRRAPAREGRTRAQLGAGRGRAAGARPATALVRRPDTAHSAPGALPAPSGAGRASVSAEAASGFPATGNARPQAPRHPAAASIRVDPIPQANPTPCCPTRRPRTPTTRRAAAPAPRAARLTYITRTAPPISCVPRPPATRPRRAAPTAPRRPPRPRRASARPPAAPTLRRPCRPRAPPPCPAASMAAQLKVPLTAAERAAPQSRVCVTGAGGYVASHVVQRLLAAGHTGEGRAPAGAVRVPRTHAPCPAAYRHGAAPCAAQRSAAPCAAPGGPHAPAAAPARPGAHPAFPAPPPRAAAPAVHAAVRSRSKAAHLEALPGARERLVFFERCDLTAPGSFDAAVEGCDYVMHTASPFMLGVRCGGRGGRAGRGAGLRMAPACTPPAPPCWASGGGSACGWLARVWQRGCVWCRQRALRRRRGRAGALRQCEPAPESPRIRARPRASACAARAR